MDNVEFVGLWKLLSFQLLHEDGKTSYPYGEKPVGYIFYGVEGYMSVHIMRNGRHRCNSNDPRSTTIEEKVEAADNYMGYSGKYTIQKQNKTIIHYPEISSFPNALDTGLKRKYKFQRHTLILIAEFPDDGFYSELVWEKVLNS